MCFVFRIIRVGIVLKTIEIIAVKDYRFANAVCIFSYDFPRPDF